MNSLEFRPALFRHLSDYTRAHFVKDLGAGATIGVVALPLAIGFGIASGVTPEQGLWTAIVAGFLISLLGGSRFQIGGPTGAFVPLLAGIVLSHGYSGLALATMMAGVMLILLGLLRLGGMLKFVPFPVVAGFTTGIAVIIFTGQLNDALGLGLKMPEHVPQQLAALLVHLPQVNLQALTVTVLTLIILYGLPKLTKAVPAPIVALAAMTMLVLGLHWDVATVGTRFGGLTAGWPGWHMPEVSLDQMRELMIPAFTIAMLGSIESLLSATVADGMTDTRHDSNQELLGQGIANLLTPLVGGIAATGAIARTAANIRMGAHSPVSGLVHSGVLLIFALVAAPLAKFIPMAALAGVLMGVAMRMAEWRDFQTLWRTARAEWAVMTVAFVLTVVFDLTIGVGAGLVMAVVLFVRRMEAITHIQILTPESDMEAAGADSLRGRTVPLGVVLYRFHGPFFFAAADKLETALQGSGGRPRVVVFRMRHVPAMDVTGLHALRTAVTKMHRDGVRILLTGVQPQPMKLLYESGLADQIGIENFCADIEEALNRCRADSEANDSEASSGQLDDKPAN